MVHGGAGNSTDFRPSLSHHDVSFFNNHHSALFNYVGCPRVNIIPLAKLRRKSNCWDLLTMLTTISTLLMIRITRYTFVLLDVYIPPVPLDRLMIIYQPLPRPRPLARKGLPLPRPRPRPRFVMFSPGTFVLFSFTCRRQVCLLRITWQLVVRWSDLLIINET